MDRTDTLSVTPRFTLIPCSRQNHHGSTRNVGVYPQPSPPGGRPKPPKPSLVMRMRRISTGSLSGVGARADLPTDLTIDRFSNIQAVGSGKSPKRRRSCEGLIPLTLHPTQPRPTPHPSSGEYANVFKATWEDGADGNWIALKVLKKEHKGKESVYADFFAEEQVRNKRTTRSERRQRRHN